MEGLGKSRALEGLNPAQLQAVTAVEGPVLILAGAGSGKTRVITHRIAYLLDRGAAPESILALTFTNRAADEMRERILGLVGESARSMWIMTFHSMCARILRDHVKEIDAGRDQRFAIYDRQDQEAAMKAAYREMNWDPKALPPGAMLQAIGRAKNELKSPSDLRRQGLRTSLDLRGSAVPSSYYARRAVAAYEAYERVLRRNNAVDFDDLLVLTARLFSDRPDILAYYRERFGYVHIDEYQDTNHAQYVIARCLAQRHGNICVVGDDDQSIYAWRGADVRNILEFENDYPNAKVIKLEQNYRSTQTILDVAGSVIRRVKNRKKKSLWTENGTGLPVRIHVASDEKDEASFVISEIQRLRARGMPLSSFAVFYRIHAQSRALEEALVTVGTPYRIYGGLRFYQRKEIKDVLAYLRLISNPKDDMSFLRAVSVPRRGAGKKTLERIRSHARGRGMSLYEAAEEISAGEGLSPGLRAFLETIGELRSAAGSADLPSLLRRTIEDSGYATMLQSEKTPEAEARLQNVQELVATARSFCEQSEDGSLEAFLSSIALVAEVDAYDPAETAVTLMTLHSAKGLEFPVVFMVGMEEGLFPLLRGEDPDEEELEEERRLCYVGMTRAMKALYLTCCRERALYGGRNERVPSRFFQDVPRECVSASPHRSARSLGE